MMSGSLCPTSKPTSGFGLGTSAAARVPHRDTGVGGSCDAHTRQAGVALLMTHTLAKPVWVGISPASGGPAAGSKSFHTQQAGVGSPVTHTQQAGVGSPVTHTQQAGVGLSCCPHSAGWCGALLLPTLSRLVWGSLVAHTQQAGVGHTVTRCLQRMTVMGLAHASLTQGAQCRAAFGNTISKGWLRARSKTIRRKHLLSSGSMRLRSRLKDIVPNALRRFQSFVRQSAQHRKLRAACMSGALSAVARR